MKIIDKIKKSEFWGSVLKLSSGQIIAQAITLLATLVLSRIYTEADYGTHGIVVSTASIIISIINLALASAVMVQDTDKDSKRVFTVAYIVQLVFLAVVSLFMLAISPYKKFFDTSAPYPVMILIMAVYIAVNTLYTMTRVYINKLKLNNILFVNSLISAGCTVFISIPMGILNFGFYGLLTAAILAEVISTLQMLRAGNPFTRLSGFDDFKKTFKDCKNFIFYQYPSNFMENFAQNLPNQTLYGTYGDAALGSYAMCNKVFQMPLNLIVTPIQTVYFRTAASMKSEGEREKLSDFTYKFLLVMMLIAVVPVTILMAFGEYIFGFVLGSKWADAGLIAAVMCPYFSFFFLKNCVTYLRVSIGKQKVNLYMTAAQFLLSFLALIVSGMMDQKVIITVGVFAGINAVFNIADIAVSFACLKKNTFKFIATSLLYILITIGGSLIIRSFM